MAHRKSKIYAKYQAIDVKVEYKKNSIRMICAQFWRHFINSYLSTWKSVLAHFRTLKAFDRQTIYIYPNNLWGLWSELFNCPKWYLTQLIETSRHAALPRTSACIVFICTTRFATKGMLFISPHRPTTFSDDPFCGMTGNFWFIYFSSWRAFFAVVIHLRKLNCFVVRHE